MEQEQVSQNTEPDAAATAPVTEQQPSGTILGSESPPNGDGTSVQPAEIKYDLKAPEGSGLDAGYVDEIVSFAKERGLSQEAAQAILERDAKLSGDLKAHQEAQIKEQAEQWKADLKADPDFGGSKYDETVRLSQRAWKQFGPKGVNLGHWGDNDVLIKFAAAVGKVMREDSLITGGTVVAPKPKSQAQRMYPNMRGAE